MYRLFNYSIILYTYSLSRRLRSSVRNLGVIFDDQLTFKDHIAKTARSCMFALHNIRKISSFHTQHAAQLLVQALVISRLRCSSSWTSIKHNQTSTDDSECSGTTGLQRTQKGPCYTSLCLCTGSRLQLASSSRHWCLHTEQPQAQHPPTSTHWWQSTSPPEAWDLRVSVASWYHHRETQHHFPERFHSPFLAGGMNFPPPSRMLDPWQSSSDTWKLISSVITWLHLKKFNTKILALFP